MYIFVKRGIYWGQFNITPLDFDHCGKRKKKKFPFFLLSLSIFVFVSHLHISDIFIFFPIDFYPGLMAQSFVSLVSALFPPILEDGERFYFIFIFRPSSLSNLELNEIMELLESYSSSSHFVLLSSFHFFPRYRPF